MQASSVEQLCFGRGPNQLNLDAVRVEVVEIYVCVAATCCASAACVVCFLQVLQRVEDLIRVIHVLIVELDSRATHWTGMLDKMNVINMNYMQVCQQLVSERTAALRIHRCAEGRQQLQWHIFAAAVDVRAAPYPTAVRHLSQAHGSAEY